MVGTIGLKMRAVSRWQLAIYSLAIVAGIAWCGSVRAADVVRVEEDWVLVVGQPDPNLDAPQVSCGISPLGDFDSAYVVFNLNHRSQPVYVPGGLQLQVWCNGSPLLSDDDPDNQIMSQNG